MATAVPSLVVGLLAGVYRRPPRPQDILIVTCLVQAVVVGLIAVAVEFDSIVGLYALLLLNAGVKQFFDPAHDSLIPELASDEELAAANSFLSIASFGSTAIGFAGAGLLAEHGRSDLGIHHRCHVVRGLRRPDRLHGPLSDAEARRRRERGGHRVQPEGRVGDAVRHADPGSLFFVGALMFFSFGLWNVLFLPFSIRSSVPRSSNTACRKG